MNFCCFSLKNSTVGVGEFHCTPIPTLTPTPSKKKPGEQEKAKNERKQLALLSWHNGESIHFC
jgi:hypothetical protein